MAESSSQIERLLSDLRQNYLQELPARLDEIDQIILNIQAERDAIENFKTLYRHIHSIKGSAGTHNLHIISSICHNFEDHLSSQENVLGNIINSGQTSIWLQYCDLLRQAALVISGDGDLSGIEERLNKLRINSEHKILTCLIVSPTKAQLQICKSIMCDFHTQIFTADNGYDALGRLLNKRYDFIITNHEINLLNGIALISAIRMSNNSNKDIHAVLMTTNDNITLNRYSDPDYIILKNNQLADNLSIVINEIVEKLSVQKQRGANTYV